MNCRGKARAQLDLGYGDGLRNRFDLFLPEGRPKGLVVFVHGGFWMRLDKSYWSHLARGSVASGYAVAMPSYTLCPDARLADITREVAAAIAQAAAMIEGPLLLTGHSAGGHLVTRMISATSPLPEQVRARVRNTVSISGVHDLRPLLKTAMNATLRIDAAEAQTESPALLQPLPGARVTCWVGGGGAPGIHPPERPAGQHLDRARRPDLRDRGARPSPFQRHRRPRRPAVIPWCRRCCPMRPQSVMG